MKSRNISLVLTFFVIVIITISLFFVFNNNTNGLPNNFTSQKIQPFQVSLLHNKTINVLATTLPQFVVDLADKKFQNLWIAHAQERESAVTSQVVSVSGIGIKTETRFDENKKQLIVTPQSENDFKPGLYKLHVTVKTYTGQDITVIQDFTWGVLAINTSKAVYQPGESIKIGMGVLDDKGNTKCIAKGDVAYNTAKVWLTITNPSGRITKLSTDNGTIVGSNECAPTSVTNNPDFQATTIAQGIGKYTIHMTAQNINGIRSSDDYFTVSNEPEPFIVMRTSYPTRIYPYGHYPVEITVIANQNYSGRVSDFVPSNFKILNISNGGSTNKTDAYQQIQWQVNWTAGQAYKLMYDINFPLVSPEFYLVGPFTIGNPSAGSRQGYTEGREWQIASDAITLVESNFAVNNANASTVSVTLSSALTANDLEIIVCAMPANMSISTPSSSGGNSWSTVFSINGGGVNPRIRAWYRLAKATDNTTFTCTFNGGTTTTNPKAIQVFEYSGLATSAIRDVVSTKSNTSCSSGQFTTNSITTGNPIELVFASEVSNGNPARNVLSHSAGFTTEMAFSGTFGTFTTADQNISSLGTFSDTVTFSGAAGTCAGGIVSFNTPISVSQGSFQFFQNTSNVTPVTAIGTKNQNLTLPTPHAQFRLRFLLDVDSTTGQTIGLQTGDFVLNYATLSANFTGCSDSSLTYVPVGMPASNSDIAWYQNSLGSGLNISSSGSDPSDAAYTTVYESYYEDNTTGVNGPVPGDITNDQNAIADAQAGLWDVSLIDNTNDVQSNSYCLKVMSGSGVALSAYVYIPTVTTFYNEVNILGGTTIQGGTTIK